jgi:alkaline phosphatase D
MTVSRREFISALGVAASAAPLLSLARPLAPNADDVDRGLFQYGVASGDPRRDSVTLWTRVTPRGRGAKVQVKWIVARDPWCRRVVSGGSVLTDEGRDYTVKVEPEHLEPGTTFYYRFKAQGANSPIGRTRTLPEGGVDRLRIAVASCSNYPYGFFNAYALIAARADLDAVLHLGDYTYEYANGTFGDGTALGREPQPPNETVTLADYRTRHALYKSDPDLQEAHRQHPFITVWDDHESTNDAWREGAENHQPETEGDWETRKARSIQAYYEWMPIRDGRRGERPIFRRFRFGELADLIMLDTRLYGRDQQAASPADVATINDPSRQMLGAAQEQWFLDRLTRSAARGAQWRLVGQQVMFAQLSLDFGRSIANADQWDGYRPARDRILTHLHEQGIGNTVVLTGDIHSSWGNDVSLNPWDPTAYDPVSGRGSLAVEFVTPGVTSPFLFPDTPEGAAQAAVAAGQLRAISPHMKWIEAFRRGYLLVDLDRDRVQGEWYYLPTIRERRAEQFFGAAFASTTGTNHLIPSAQSAPRGDAPDPAP